MSPRWIKSSVSGLLIPAPPDEKLEQRKNILSLDNLNESLGAVRALVSKYRIPNFAASDLGQLVVDVEKVANKISSTVQCFLHINDFMDCLSFARISNTVTILDGHPQAAVFLKKLTDGPIRMRKRRASCAKDTLWELEMLKKLQDCNIPSRLQEPPDIVWTLNGQSSGIACKKLYSTKHVQYVLSKGVSQIKQSGGYGIVAFNLDELMPNGAFRAPRDRFRMLAVKQLTDQFILRHASRFSKYAREGRLFGIVVSTTSISFINQPAGYLPSSMENQWTIWIPADLPNEQSERINLFRQYIERKR